MNLWTLVKTVASGYSTDSVQGECRYVGLFVEDNGFLYIGRTNVGNNLLKFQLPISNYWGVGALHRFVRKNIS